MWLERLAQRWPYIIGLLVSCVLIVIALNNSLYVIWRSAFPTSDVDAIDRALFGYALLGGVGLVVAAFCVMRLLRKRRSS